MDIKRVRAGIVSHKTHIVPSQAMSAAATEKVGVVTGANAGLGYQIARALYAQGMHVVVAGRNPARVSAAIDALSAEVRGPQTGVLEPGILDLACLDSVAEFSQAFSRRHDRIDLLINNAGVMVPPAGTTKDGFETQFGINFVGHFALTGHLYPALEATPGARVVTMSSIGHRGAAIDFDNLRLEKPYSQWREYGQSKLADLMFALELHERLRACGAQLASLGAHPGVSKTELTRNLGDIPAHVSFMSPEQGARSALVAALSTDAMSGQYWGPNGPEERAGDPGLAAVDPAALDAKVRARLWAWAEEATGVSYPR